MDLNSSLTAIGTIIALIATFITALTSARSSSFNELKHIVELLKVQIDEQKKTIERQSERITELSQEVEIERELRKGYERYTKALSTILKKEHIQVPNIKDFIPQGENHTGAVE